MVTSRDVRLEGKRLEEEMDELRQHWHELDAGLHYARNGVRVSWLIGSYLLKRDLEKRIYELRLRRNMVQNSYIQLRKDEARRV